jgi:diaminohydroxyphosphoribosylaminopyrimidine deaminase / 5-amino-6-(5-phosphoribosylamino)uracil reductase
LKNQPSSHDLSFMREALRLARLGCGDTAPNPMVGAVLVKSGQIIGRGWHRGAGFPHAEIEAFTDARRKKKTPAGATLYVTLEPCCTHGRTPPCTQAIKAAGVRRVIVAATDPNPVHAGRGFRILRRAGIEVKSGLLAAQVTRLNEAFNCWIIHRTPFVTIKSAMSLDGRIATHSGESKWITGPEARARSMQLRQGTQAILVGVNTILADDPSLTIRRIRGFAFKPRATALRRIVLDCQARTPPQAKIVSDEHAALTTIVVGPMAPATRVKALARRAKVIRAPMRDGGIDLRWLLQKLGSENIISLLVEGGGEVNASFLLGGLAHRIVFFYAPKLLGGRNAPKAVAGDGAASLKESLSLRAVEWSPLGEDLMLTARVADGA